ncbi:hypothetical protein HDU91_006385, partial [Kappamyces sp. JEL0680]
TSSDQDESDSSPPIQRVSKTNILDDALVQVDIDALPKEEQKLERARRLAKLQRRRSGHLDTSEEEELAKTKRTVKRGARILRSMGTEPEIGHLPSEPDPTSSSDSDSDMAVAVSARRRRGKRKHQGSEEQSSASPRRHKRSRHRRPLSEVSDDDIAFETHRLERVPELRDLTEDAANGTFLYCTRCQYYLVKDSFSAAQQKNFISRYCLMHHSGGKIGGQMYVDLLQAKVREDKRSLQREEDYSADERTGSSDYEGSFIASDEEENRAMSHTETLTPDSVDLLQQSLQKRLSILSLDSGYGSMLRENDWSAGDVAYWSICSTLGPLPLEEWLPLFGSAFAPTLTLDFKALSLTLNDGTDTIHPAILDEKILQEFKGVSFTHLDSQVIVVVYRFLKSFALESVSDLTRAGLRYYRGTPGIERDFSRAFYWFKKAVGRVTNPASYAAAQALACLGKCHLLGHGTPKATSQAFDYFLEAARYTDSASKLQLLLFFVANMLEQDYPKAMWWLGTIAQDYGPAQYLLAQCFHQGLYGLQPDAQMAQHWFGQACKSGFDKDTQRGLSTNFSWEIFS